MKVLLTATFSFLAAQSFGALLFDNIAQNEFFTSRPAGSPMPAGRWTNLNGTSVTLTRVSFYGDIDANSNIEFVFADGNGIVSQVVTVFRVDIGLGLYSADVNWTINPSSDFTIGSLVEQGSQFGARFFPSGIHQNGLLAIENGNFEGYGNHIWIGPGAAEMNWVLEGEPVPEPASLCVLGFAALVFARKRSKSEIQV